MANSILFLEPLKDGHRVLDVMAIASAAPRHRDLQLTFLVHPWIKDHLSSLSFPGKDDVEIIALAPSDVAGLTASGKQPGKARNVLRVAERVATQRQIAHINIRHLDLFLLVAPLYLAGRRRQSWSGMLFSPAIHYRKVYRSALSPRRRLYEAVKHVAIRLLLANRRFRLLQSYDPEYVKVLKSSKSVAVPDHPQDASVEEEPADLDLSWQTLPHRILCFGALSRRHGIYELCEALSGLDIGPQSVGIVFAGNTAEGERARFREALAELSARQPNLRIQYLERYLSDGEIEWLFHRCSLVAMPYRGAIGSSSVLYWAARAGRPVVAPKWGQLGHMVVQNGLGVTVETADPAAIAAGLEQVMSGPVFDTEKAQAFTEYNTASNFAEVYLAHLEAALCDHDTRS